MKFGLMLPYCPFTNEQRLAWAKRSFASLAKTDVSNIETPTLLMICRGLSTDQASDAIKDCHQFVQTVVVQPSECANLDSAMSWGYYQICEKWPDVTHLVLIVDDWIYNPAWLKELQALISRHLTARAWSVYRSAYNRHHWPIREEGQDVLVRCVAGPVCLSKEEWLDWGLDWHVTAWDIPTSDDGNTLDLYHCYARPGERWTTAKSYIENIGTRGVHQDHMLEHAVDFVGE